MPARKAATKKKKVSAKKTTAKKASRSATAAASRKKAARGSSAKKTASKKGASKKRTPKKTSVKKAVSKKTSTKRAKAKPASRKKVAKKKATKKPSKKKTAKKAVAQRTSAKKTPSKKKTSKRPPSKKKTAPASSRAKEVRTKRISSANLLTGPLRDFSPYQPKRGEAYMSDSQLEHFREILLAWKRELMEEVDRTVLHMKDDAANFPDPNDRATQESEFGLELRTRDRERKLLKKIDSALSRIDDGSYGYCEETGDEIGLRRLEARPVATLCVEAQERRELAERQFRDREDYYR